MRKAFYVTILIVLFGVIITGCNVTSNDTNATGESDFRALGDTVDGADTVDLIAGQHIDVGDIKICNNGESLFIKFNTTAGWYMTETHLAVETTVDDIPQTKKGNPIPGKFSYKVTHNPVVGQYTYKIDLESAGFAQGDEIFVAAHADVQRIEEGSVIQQETAWGEGELFGGRNWATYTTYVVKRNIYLTFERFIPGIEARTGYHTVGGLALSPDESLLYTAHWQTSGADPIGVYLTADYSLFDWINGGNCVGNVVTSNDGCYVYATDYYGGYIHRYDTCDNNTKSSIHLGSWAENLWKSPNGERIIVHYNSVSGAPLSHHSLALIDIAGDNFSVIDSFNTGRPMSNLSAAFSDDGQHIYIACGSSETAGPTLIDVGITGTFQIERELVLAAAANQTWRMAGVARSGGRLFVGDRTGGKLHIVDEATFEKIGEVPLSENLSNIAIHPDQRHLFIMYDSGTLSVIDLCTMTEVFSLPGLNLGLNAAVFTADGRKVYVSHGDQTEGGFSVIAVHLP